MHYGLRWILACLLSAGLVAGPSVARASEPGDHGTTEVASGGGHGEEKRPPLLSFDPGTAIWSIIVFLLLLALLRAFAWKPILAGLQQREKFIFDSIEEAKRQRTEAEETLKRYTEQIHHARLEATGIVEEGRRDAEAVRRRIHEEARAEAHAMIERAKRELGIARDDAIKALYRQSVELSTQIAAKLVRRQLSPQDQQALIDEALTEIGNMRR